MPEEVWLNIKTERKLLLKALESLVFHIEASETGAGSSYEEWARDVNNARAIISRAKNSDSIRARKE